MRAPLARAATRPEHWSTRRQRNARCALSGIRFRLWRGRRRRTLGPPHGVLDQLRGGGEVEFLLNLFPVMLDGLDAQMKGARDLARGLPLTEQMQDLAFAIRETMQ